MGLITTFYLLMASSALASFHNQTYDTHDYYALHHDPAYAPLDDVAGYFGLHIVEPIGALPNFWLARKEAPLHRRQDALSAEPDTVIDSSRKMRRRPRRGMNMTSAVKHLSRQLPRKIDFKSRAPPSPSTPKTKRVESGLDYARGVAQRLGIRDPMFTQQWSVSNLNVFPVWDQLGYTGEGIITAVLDAGLMFDHEDLRNNFAHRQSYDFVRNSPELPPPSESHGTGCAGIIAAVKNNVCGVGIAYKSQVAGLRIMGLDGIVDDVRHAMALNYAPEDISIYSSSIGGPNEPTFVEEFGYVPTAALIWGTTYGRGNKGSIYVNAAGNGGAKGNNCNFDGNTNSIYTITVGAAKYTDEYAPYTTPCTAVMTAAYSSSVEVDLDLRLMTLDTTSTVGCGTDNSVGTTSAAAPAAAGVIALALETNPHLSWRDIQHIIVETSRPLGDESQWTRLASGRSYSERLGFGILDAYAVVTTAYNWKYVERQTYLQTQAYQYKGGRMDERGRFSGGVRLSKEGVSQDMPVTQDMTGALSFDKIEHVQVRVWVDHEKRGDISVSLTSPRGIVSKLGVYRPQDKAKTGLQGWTFMSLKHWGESPVGTWTLKVNDRFDKKHAPKAKTGRLIGFSLTFWGSALEGTPYQDPYQMPADDLNVFPPADGFFISL